MDKEAPLRVLHVADMNRKSGVSSMLMNFYRHMDHEKIQFDFAVFCQDEDNYAAEIEAMGGRVFVLPLATKPLAFARAFGPLAKQYRIVHVHDMVASVEALWIARREGVQARVIHSHSSSIDTPFKRMVVRCSRVLLRNLATHLYATSLNAGTFLFGDKAHARVEILQNAIDPTVFRFDAKLRQTTLTTLGIENRFVVGHIGRFSIEKNHAFLLDVFSKILESRPNAVLLLVGEGELRTKIRRQAERLGIEDSVLFVGRQRDVHPFLCAMDVFVFPSLFEGFGLALLEAQANGLLCVASEKAIPREVDVTGIVRFLSLQEDSSLWADAIICHQRVLSRENVAFQAFADIRTQASALAALYRKM